MKTDILSIVLVCDERYISHTATTIASIICNSIQHYHFYILDCGISPQSVEKLKTWDIGENEIRVIPVQKVDFFEQYKIAPWFSPAIFYRLVIPEILQDLEKVLYLDSDIIALKEIKTIYDIPLEECLLAGVDEKLYFQGAWYEKRNQKNGYPESYTYMNSGVLWMNLKAMREFGFSKKILQYLQKHPDFLFPDQDAINYFLKDSQKKFIDCRYNFLLPMKKKKNLKHIHPVFCHFSMKPKPWFIPIQWLSEKMYFYPFFKQYYFYLQKTPFAKNGKKSISYFLFLRMLWKQCLQPIEEFFRENIRNKIVRN